MNNFTHFHRGSSISSNHIVFLVILTLGTIVLIMFITDFSKIVEYRSVKDLIRNGIPLNINRDLPRPDPSFKEIPKILYGLGSNDTSATFRTYYNQTVKPPGVVLALKGGIGNQLFQYACSYALAKDMDFPLYILHDPLTGGGGKGQGGKRRFAPFMREFALDQFNIPLDNFVNRWSVLNITSFINDQDLLENTFLFRWRHDLHKRFLRLSGGSYCQSIEFWVDYQDEIRTMFQPRPEVLRMDKLQPILDKIENSESVCIHVRRGDFTRASGFDVPISFQRHAIRKMTKILETSRKVKPVFFVFSDDIDYANQKLRDFENSYEFIYVSKAITNSTSIEEFYLMTQCKHIIFPNSTFSWWAAFLMRNKEKIVITSTFNILFFGVKPPKHQMTFFERTYGTLYHPKEWIILNPFTGVLELGQS